MIIIEGM